MCDSPSGVKISITTGADAERTLQSIHTNFVRLTHRVPMVEVKDLLEAMQCQVVGVP